MSARAAPAPDSPGAGAVGPGPPRRRRRWGRWLLALGLGLIVLVAAALLAIRHPPIATGLVNAVLGRLALVPRSTTSIQEVRGDWISGLELHGLRITRGDTLLAAVDTLRARYRLASLLVGRPEVDDIHVGGVLLTAGIAETTRPTERKPTPRLTLLDLLRGRFYSGPPLRIERATVRDARYGGHAGAPDSAFTRFDLRARRVRLGGGFSFELDTLGLSGRGVTLALVARLDEGRFELRSMRMHGASSDVEARGFALGARDSLAGAGLTLRAQPLSLRDLEALIPGLRLDGVVLADADLHGSRADRLSGTLAASMERGRFANFELGPTRIDAVLTDGRAELTASARYEGALATLGGWARPLDATPSYDLDFEIDRLPMRLPGVPGWAALAERVDGAAKLGIRGTGYARAVLEVAGHIEIDDGSIDLEGRLDLTRGFAWDVKRLAFDRVDVAALAGDTTTSALTGTLTASGAGVAPESRRAVAALEIGPSHVGDLAVAGARVRARMDGTNLGGSLRLQTDAGAVEVDSLTAQWAGQGRFRVNAAFHDVDLARLARQPALPTRLEGTLSAQGRGLASLGAPGGAAGALRQGRLSGDARLELKPSEFRGQEIAGVTRVTLARGALELDGSLTSPAGRIDLDAAARPFDPAPAYELRRARFEDVDLAAWTEVPSLTSRISGSLTGAGHPGGAAGRAEDWKVALHLDPSRVGPARLEGGDARATWSAGRAGLVANLRASGDTASVRGDIDLRDRDPRGQAELSIPFGLLTAAIGRDSLSSRGRLEAAVSFAGLSPARATAEGSITGRGAIDRARLDSLFAGFRLRDGTLTLDTLVARSNVGTASGVGRVALFDSTASDSSDLRVALAVGDVSLLRGLLGADTVAVGSGTLDLRLGGSAVERRVDARGSLRSAAWNELRVMGASCSAQGTLDQGWRPTKMSAEASIRRLHGLAVPVSEATLKATLDGDRTDFDLAVAMDATHRLHSAGNTLADSLGTRITLATLDLQADSAAWKLERTAHVDLRPGRFGVEDFELRSARGRVTAQGVIDRRGTQDFRLDLRGVPLDIVSTLLGREDVSGTLSGAFALEGPAAAPKGRGDLLLDLLSEGEMAGSLRSNMAWDGAQLDFRGRFATPESDSIAWTGHLPLTVSLAVSDSAGAPAPVRMSEGEVDVRIVADRFPLAGLSPLLDPRVMGHPSGILDIDAGIRGRSRSLAGSGTVALIDGALPFPGLGVTYQDLNLMARFDGNRLVLQRAHAVSNKGTLDVSGEIRFVSATQIEPRLQIKASRFEFVQTPDVRAILSGEVDLSGSVAAPVVKATATIENSTFTFAQSDLAGGTPGSEVKLSDADLRMMEETFGYVNAKTPTGDLLRLGYEASDLDLTIRLERNNWLRQRVQPKLAVALTGQFRLRKKPHAEPELFGRIEPIPGRGYVEQFARSFDIVGGEVLLNGKMKDHRVDLQAQYKPPTSTESSEDEVVVNLDVEGTAEKLSLTLSSEPAMSEAEIVNYIATGQSPVDHSSSSSSESNTSMLKDIGLSAVTGGAEQAAQEKIGLDVLQVRFDALQGATLVAGRYLDSQLYIGFRQPLQYQDTGTTNSETTSRTSVEVEYAIYRWLVVNLQGETSKLRSFFRARHAY